MACNRDLNNTDCNKDTVCNKDYNADCMDYNADYAELVLMDNVALVQLPLLQQTTHLKRMLVRCFSY